MDKKKWESNLIIEVKIQFQGKIVNLTFRNILKWLVPAILAFSQLVSFLREKLL